MTTSTLAPPEIIDPFYYEENGYPHDAWQELRRTNPIARCEFEHFLPFWAVTKREDILRISKDPELFQSAPLLAVTRLEEGVDPYAQTLRHLLNMDLPDHRTYRRLLSARFTPRAVRPQFNNYEVMADEILDLIAEREQIDFVTEVAAKLPIWVIADIMGVPPGDRDQFFAWTNEIIGSGDPEFKLPDSTATETFLHAVQELQTYFRSMVEQRRCNPTDDLTSALANATIDGKPIPDFELYSNLVVLIVAGNETTRNAATGGLRAFIENPGEWQKLCADPGLLDSAVEEVVRWVTPVIHFCRTPSRDVELGGNKIAAGEHLALFYPSGNRDEEAFDDPFSFRIDRNPNPHVGFGVGEHLCLGAHIARAELKALFSRLTERMESVEPDGEMARLRSSFVGGIKHMPVRLKQRT